MPLLELTCRSCGAKLSDMPDRDRFFCPFCGALYQREQSVVQSVTNITCDTVQVQTADFEIRSGMLIKYGGASQDPVIPDSVSEIGVRAFSGSTIQTVFIPSSVKKIGAYAFSDCSNLTHVTIPDSVSEIGNRAFFRCFNLKEIVLPSTYHCSLDDSSPFVGTPYMDRIHRNAEQLREQELRQFRIANNLCPNCGKMYLFGRCVGCGAKKN